MFEIKIPEEVTKTPKAMENVLHAIWNMYDPPTNIRQYWIEGKWMEYYSFEIVGRKGEIHFYIRTPEKRKDVARSAIYGEYPDAEIKEVQDYVYKFKEIPNEDYDLWGADMMLLRPDPYPIRTHEYWETQVVREEKKVDPLAALFEVFGNLKEGEEVWVQIKACPLTDDEHPYLEETKKLVNKLMKRPEEKKPGLLEPLALSRIPADIWKVLIEGKPIPPVIEEEVPPRLIELGLMKLTPGEAEVLRAIEENTGKYVYEMNLRFLYVAKREVFSPARGVAAICGAFNQFNTVNLNGFKPDKTKTMVTPWFFEKRRLYVRKRKNFRYYAKRMWPWHRKPYIFSITELATIFHFPGKAVAPSAAVPRAEVRKGGPPPAIPR